MFPVSLDDQDQGRFSFLLKSIKLALLVKNLLNLVRTDYRILLNLIFH